MATWNSLVARYEVSSIRWCCSFVFRIGKCQKATSRLSTKKKESSNVCSHTFQLSAREFVGCFDLSHQFASKWIIHFHYYCTIRYFAVIWLFWVWGVFNFSVSRCWLLDTCTCTNVKCKVQQAQISLQKSENCAFFSLLFFVCPHRIAVCFKIGAKRETKKKT